MPWLDYCEYCGSAEEPILKTISEATLEGEIVGNEVRDETIKTKNQKRVWVCSDCGKEIAVDDG